METSVHMLLSLHFLSVIDCSIFRPRAICFDCGAAIRVPWKCAFKMLASVQGSLSSGTVHAVTIRLGPRKSGLKRSSKSDGDDHCMLFISAGLRAAGLSHSLVQSLWCIKNLLQYLWSFHYVYYSLFKPTVSLMWILVWKLLYPTIKALIL